MGPKLVNPDTVKVDNVPTDVMLGCDAVVTVPAVVAESALPAVAALRFATWPGPNGSGNFNFYSSNDTPSFGTTYIESLS